MLPSNAVFSTDLSQFREHPNPLKRLNKVFHHFNGGLDSFGGNSAQETLDAGSGEGGQLRKLKNIDSFGRKKIISFLSVHFYGGE